MTDELTAAQHRAWVEACIELSFRYGRYHATQKEFFEMKSSMKQGNEIAIFYWNRFTVELMK